MSIHICAYKKDKNVAEKIVKSLKNYGGISEIIVYTDHADNVKDLEELSDKFTKYTFKAIYDWTYELVSYRIANDLPDIKKQTDEVLVNITGTPPEIAFAIRYATIISPTKVYYLDESDIVKEIDSEPIPDYYSLTNNELRILHDIGMNGKTRKDIFVRKNNGSELKNRGKNDAINGLKNKKLINFEYIFTEKPGRRPELIKRTKLGDTFYRLHEKKIMNVIDNMKQEPF